MPWSNEGVLLMPNEQTNFLFSMKSSVTVKETKTEGIVTNRTIDTPTQKNKYQVFCADADPMVDWFLEDDLEAS